jgi:hypothetical protein
MRLISFLSVSLFTSISCYSQEIVEKKYTQSGSPIIENVSVIPMTCDTVLLNHDVWIENGIIKKIIPHRRMVRKRKTVVINGKGKFLIPSLTDAHVHYGNDKTLFGLYDSLYLKYGVTNIFALNGNKSVLTHRNAINTGKRIGPMIFCSSPPLNDSTLSADSAKSLVATLEKEGYDFIKVYTYLSKEGFRAVDQEAARLSFPVIGHIPMKVGFFEVIGSSQSLIAHVEEFMYNEPVKYMMGNIENDFSPSSNNILAISDSVSNISGH